MIRFTVLYFIVAGLACCAFSQERELDLVQTGSMQMHSVSNNYFTPVYLYYFDGEFSAYPDRIDEAFPIQHYHRIIGGEWLESPKKSSCRQPVTRSGCIRVLSGDIANLMACNWSAWDTKANERHR